MRVVVVGATGNVGTSLVRLLHADSSVREVIGLARRVPSPDTLDIEWRRVDILTDDLETQFGGADAVIHLAWSLEPVRNSAALYETNVRGSSRLFDAVAAAGVRTLVYASSAAVYSPAPTGTPVDEQWPTGGIPTSSFSQQKVAVERVLDKFEADHQLIRVVRLRPGPTFKPEAASEIRRRFIGPLLTLVGSPVARHAYLPEIEGLASQLVHTEDVAQALASALFGSVTGAYNICSPQVVDANLVAERFGLRRVRIPPRAARGAIALGWYLGAQSIEPGWFDLAMQSPLLQIEQATAELGWSPTHQVMESLSEFAEALAVGTGFPTPPLIPGPALRRRHGDTVTGRLAV